jgi:hypothetical protein
VSQPWHSLPLIQYLYLWSSANQVKVKVVLCVNHVFKSAGSDQHGILSQYKVLSYVGLYVVMSHTVSTKCLPFEFLYGR